MMRLIGRGRVVGPKVVARRPVSWGGVGRFVLGLALALLVVVPARASAASGASVFVTNNATNGVGGVSQYDIGAGSALSPKTTPTVAAGNGPVGVAVSHDGKSVYATNNDTNEAG